MKYLHKSDIEIPLYRGKLIVILTNDIDKLKEIIPDFRGETIYGHAYCGGYKESSGYFVVLNFNNPIKKITHGVITHESIHITSFLAEHVGFVPDFENDEPITYLAEWVTDEIYKLIKKHKKEVI